MAVPLDRAYVPADHIGVHQTWSLNLPKISIAMAMQFVFFKENVKTRKFFNTKNALQQMFNYFPGFFLVVSDRSQFKLYTFIKLIVEKSVSKC